MFSMCLLGNGKCLMIHLAVLKQCKSVTNGGMLLYEQNHRVAYTSRGNNAQSHKISGM